MPFYIRDLSICEFSDAQKLWNHSSVDSEGQLYRDFVPPLLSPESSESAATGKT